MLLKSLLLFSCLMAVISANGQHTKVYSFVEIPPSFPGGEAALLKYLTKEIKYKPIEDDFEGHARVQFLIDTLGCVYNVKPMDTTKVNTLVVELMRVVRMMPAWNPGMHLGKKVVAPFYLPLYISPNFN